MLRDTPPSLKSGASPFSCVSGYFDIPLLRYPVMTFESPSVGKSSTYCRNVPISRSKRSCALSACDAMTAELFEPTLFLCKTPVNARKGKPKVVRPSDANNDGEMVRWCDGACMDKAVMFAFHRAD